MGERATGMNKIVVEAAIGILANNMRIYVEAQMRFAELFKVDREEAINNVDRAFDAKLEALHTLHDVTKNHFPWFDFGDTLLLIALRNAIHHRNHPLFRSLNSELWLGKEPGKWVGASFLLARHRIEGDSPVIMEHHLKLDDFRSRLDPEASSPHLDTLVKDTRARRRYQHVAADLSFTKIYEVGLRDRFPTDHIYLDMIPIFVSAVCRIFKALHASGVEFKGFDAAVYLEPFTSEIKVDLNTLLYRTPRFYKL